jgi:hypothetical protein
MIFLTQKFPDKEALVGGVAGHKINFMSCGTRCKDSVKVKLKQSRLKSSFQ